MTPQVRTRFAPAPTGNLHIGGARSALFNYLFAKNKGGSFILRIDDTDVERSKPEFEKDILESFEWLKIPYDEGPIRQSDRLDIYENYLKKLLKENKAYYCFCREEELEAQRQEQMSGGEAPKYSGRCSKLSKTEVEKNLKEGKPSVIRFAVEPKKVKFKDIIRQEVEFDMGLAGDIVIAKTLTCPLYNFTSVVDDSEMKISHVIRGEEHLSNTPRQILLQEALGFDRLEYAHLPLILSPDRSKMSKRQGDVAVSDYRKEGYLPEAIINFIAFLGWNPGNEREIYALPSLIKEFSLERVQKAGAIFNVQRLDFLNGFYIRQRSMEKLTELCLAYLPALDFEQAKKIVFIHQERLKKLSEIAELTDFFFQDKLNYDKGLLKWKDMTEKEIKESLEKSEKIISGIREENWETKESLQNILLPEAEQLGDKGIFLWALRAALGGKQTSAGPFEIAWALGKEKTLKRLKEAKDILGNPIS